MNPLFQAVNKPRLLQAGVMDACLTLIRTDVMAVVFKLLGVLRMLIEGQGEYCFSSLEIS